MEESSFYNVMMVIELMVMDVLRIVEFRKDIFAMEEVPFQRMCAKRLIHLLIA